MLADMHICCVKTRPEPLKRSQDFKSCCGTGIGKCAGTVTANGFRAEPGARRREAPQTAQGQRHPGNGNDISDTLWSAFEQGLTTDPMKVSEEKVAKRSNVWACHDEAVKAIVEIMSIALSSRSMR